WYAQRHPDEDWAETFAVWLTPNSDWRTHYADWPAALAKLQYCDQVMATLKSRPPIVTSQELDEDVSELEYSVEKFYQSLDPGTAEAPAGLDAMLHSIFYESPQVDGAEQRTERAPASALLYRIQPHLIADVYRWTGHFPERTKLLLRTMAERADALNKSYPVSQEVPIIISLTTLITALAMNYVRYGSYSP